jgi:hypothetical protein
MSEQLVPGGNGLMVIAENSEDVAAIGNILKAMEGMQDQIAALTDLIVQQDARIDALEKKGKPKLISVRN